MATRAFAGRREDEPLLRGIGTFIDGLQAAELNGALQGHFVRSIEPHARLLGVDVEEALALDGVAAVFVGSDVDGWPLPRASPR